MMMACAAHIGQRATVRSVDEGIPLSTMGEKASSHGSCGDSDSGYDKLLIVLHLHDAIVDLYVADVCIIVSPPLLAPS